MILSIQPRVAVGSPDFVVLLAGTLGERNTFNGAAAKEPRAKTGLEMR